MSYHVTRADRDEASLAAFMDALQSRNRHAIGFLPFVAIREALERGRVLVAWENGDYSGYMIHGVVKQETKILQTVVAEDARRIQHATALIEGLEILANNVGGHTISLHCAEDLDANQFWKALGFSQIGKRLKSKKRDRWQLRHEISLPGKEISRITGEKRIKLAGVGALQKLLVKGDIRVGTVDFAKHRAKRHQIELGQQ